MRNASKLIAFVPAAVVLGLAPMASLAQATDLVPLEMKLPKPVFAGTPKEVPPGTTVEPPSKKPRAIPMVPKGTTNVALKKKVTCSGKGPFSGTLDMVTDGDKEARDGSSVELRPNLQWVQVDLGAEYNIHVILLWHFHLEPVVYRDVVIQASNDPDFVDGVVTVFNNDQDNTAGLGIGKDREYFEVSQGKLVECTKAKGRYVRCYSKGSTYRDQLNRYTEIEVFGTK